MKRTWICALLLAALLSQACGCADKSPPIEDTTTTNVATSTETTTTEIQAPAEVILNDSDSVYTIVRAENADDVIIDLATDLRLKLNEMADNGSAVKISDDWTRDVPSTDDKFEILIGTTNRTVISQIADSLPGYYDFSVTVTGNKICVFANTNARLQEAVDYFLANVTAENGKLIYRGGNHVDRYTYPMATMNICGTPVKDFIIVLPANASDTERDIAQGIQAYITEKSGTRLEIVEDTTALTDAEILIGSTNRPQTNNLPKEGYKIMTDDKKLSIIAASSAYYYSAKSKLISLLDETNGTVAGGTDITVVDSALDFFLKDNYVSGLIKEDMTLGAMAILSCCEYYNDRMIYGSENLGERWVYSNRGANAAQTGYFDDMLTSSKKGGNCASPINWALTDMGVVPANDRFYGGSTGNFASYSKEAQTYLAPYCDIIDYFDSPITFKELYQRGEVKVGDIFLCKHHTFVYRGDETFYAAGHDGAWHTEADAPTEDERKAVFDNWVLAFDEVARTGEKSTTSYNTNYNYKVYYVVRLKDDYVPKFYRNHEGKVVPNPMITE